MAVHLRFKAMACDDEI